MNVLKANENDVNTYSNFDEVIQKHVDLDVSIDFKRQQMFGIVKTTYEILNESLQQIILDLHGPNISSINIINEELDEIPLEYEIYDKNDDKDALGTPLIIYLEPLKKENNVEYEKIFSSYQHYCYYFQNQNLYFPVHQIQTYSPYQ